MRKLNDVPKERERGKGKGEREKRKEKREIAAVVNLLIDQYMGVRDDSTPYNNCTQNLLW